MIKRTEEAKSGNPAGMPDDPALREALNAVSGMGRLSTQDIRTMRAAKQRACAAAALLVLSVGGWHYLRPVFAQPESMEYATKRGERREVRLEDGSVLQLNGGSQIGPVDPKLRFWSSWRTRRERAGCC